MKTVIEHLATQHGAELAELTYVPTFRDILNKHAQNTVGGRERRERECVCICERKRRGKRERRKEREREKRGMESRGIANVCGFLGEIKKKC